MLVILRLAIDYSGLVSRKRVLASCRLAMGYSVLLSRKHVLASCRLAMDYSVFQASYHSMETGFIPVFEIFRVTRNTTNVSHTNN
jgi:hypothetical protein